jgi:cell division protein FtsI (penicillin-binding protein 3)
VRDFKTARAPDASSPWLRLRVRLLGAFFLLLLGCVLARAVSLQILDRDKLRGLAEDQYVRQLDIPPRRGDIFDRRGIPLAQSVEVDSISMDPSMAPDLRQVSRDLARGLHLDAEELYGRLERAKRFAWIKRQAKPDEAVYARQLDIPGVGFVKEARRFYPQRELAAHVIGLVGTDGKGLEGVEKAFDDELTGEGAQFAGFRDAKGRKLLTQVDLAADRPGGNVWLTLDGQLQYVTEKALARVVEESKAPDGMAVVLDPKTGELLALANYPPFNPNSPQDAVQGVMRDRAALDAFEPGSTFKSFVIADALDEGAIKPEDIFFCENGAWEVGGHTIHDTHSHGWLTPEKILQVSSNICAAKIAQLLGRDRLVRAFERFGFGQRAGLALPGEGHGSVPYPRAEVALATQAYGQGVSATAVQLAAAYGAIANGGILMRPYLVSRVVDPDGTVLLENRPSPVRRVVSEKTARKVVSMLESVVVRGGTAPRAAMDDYRVAGKTGTAQKPDPVARGYSDKHVASFVGIVPAEDPRVVILVVVDEPKIDIYGADGAAPAVKEIATMAMPYLGVPPSRPHPAPDSAQANSPRPSSGEAQAPAPDRSRELLDAMAAAAAAPPRQPAERESARAPPPHGVHGLVSPGRVAVEAGPGSVKVPDLEGKPGREAVARLLAVALQPRLEGSGRVLSQSPGPGALVDRGARVTLELGLAP